MRVIFTQAARAELLEAQAWYKAQQLTLGVRFREEVEAAVTRMTENPHQFPAVFQDVHRARLRRFPSGLFPRLKRTL